MSFPTARRTALSLAGLAATTIALSSLVPAQAAPTTKAIQIAQTTSTTRNDQSGPKIAREWAAAWNSSDTTLLAKLFTKNGVYTDYGVGKSVTGREGVTGWKAGTDQLIADVHITVLNAFRSGDHVAIETIYSGHVRGAPTAFAVPSTTILDLHHGKIAENRDNYSVATLLAQSGLPADWTPPTGS